MNDCDAYEPSQADKGESRGMTGIHIDWELPNRVHVTPKENLTYERESKVLHNTEQKFTR